jgi:hypothetical protein
MEDELIKTINENEVLIKFLNGKGIINEYAMERMEIYSYYYELINNGYTKMDAYSEVAEKYHKDETTIGKIINKFRKDV